MDSTMITALSAVGVALVSGAFTYRASARASRIDERKVDADAYDRATALWEKNLAFSEKQVQELRRHVDRLEEELRQKAELEAVLRRTVARMRRTIDRMERYNALLRAQLRAAGIDIPEPPSESDEDPETDLRNGRTA